jgi:hypothetical protein
MFIVIENRVYSDVFDEENERYPLVSIAKASTGVITVTDEGDGVAALPATYRKCTLEEVLAIFNIVANSEYEPPATITGNDPVIIYLDEANKAVTLTVANPSAGDFSSVASSSTAIATVAEADGVFTITPVAAGSCAITATWTPTDTDFAASAVTIPVVVAKRKIEFAPVRNQSLTKSVDKTIILQPNVEAGSTLVYTVTSTDTGICSAAITGTEGHLNDLVLTVADTSPLGKCTISVSATDSNGKADDSDVMSFDVEVCDAAVTITAIADTTVEAGKSKEITVTCAGAEIREVTTSDATHVTVEKTAPLKFTVTAVGDAEDTAVITVYCDKRGYGEDDEALTVTIT